MTGPGVYPQFYHLTQCPAVLICKGVGLETNEGYDYFKFHERRLFHILYQPRVLGDNRRMWSPFLHSFKKGLSFFFSLGKKRIYLETQLK